MVGSSHVSEVPGDCLWNLAAFVVIVYTLKGRNEK